MSEAKKSSGKQTVATLAATVEELQQRVAALEAALAAQSATGATAAGAVAAVAASAEEAPAPAPKPRKPDTDPVGGAHRLLRDILKLAMEPEPDDPEEAELLFVRFLDHVHSERKGTPILENSLRQYTWRQLRRNALIYLRDPEDAGSFDVTRQDPAAIGPRTESLKLFLRATSRMPTPITLRRDVAAEDAWRIESSSL